MCVECNWQYAIEDIDEMLEEYNYQFAEYTLTGIRDWVDKNKHITEAQQDAIDNIRNSRS